MKLETILKEERTAITFRDLSPVQVGLLVRIKNGQFDPDSASNVMLSNLDILQDYGLLDDVYDLTQAGAKAADIGERRGSGDRQSAAVRDDALGRTGGKPKPYGSDGVDDVDTSGEAAPFQNRWQDVRNVD